MRHRHDKDVFESSKLWQNHCFVKFINIAFEISLLVLLKIATCMLLLLKIDKSSVCRCGRIALIAVGHICSGDGIELRR